MFTVKSFQDYFEVVDHIKPKRAIFRGQTKRAAEFEKYQLIPSLGRFKSIQEMGVFDLLKLELEILDTFSNHVLSHVNHLPRNDWEMLALGQHHGLPTRFMDWTTNPLVALYFACRNAKAETDSVVYVYLDEIESYHELARGDEAKYTVTENLVKELGDMLSNIMLPKSEATEQEKKVLPKEKINWNEEEKALEDKLVTHFDKFIKSPFTINRNILYNPAHVSNRIQAQDGVLMAFQKPLEPLPKSSYIEIIIKHILHNYITD